MNSEVINAQILKNTITKEGVSLYDLSMKHPLMVVFLRHFGCIFCKEALKDLSKKKAQLEMKGINLVFVHMSDHETAQEYFSNYDLNSFYSVSDPECKVYEDFGLVKGSFGQLFGLTVMIRGIQANMDGNAFSLKHIGDGFQMPGIFLINQGSIEESFIHNRVSDKPDYEDLISCCAA